MRSTVGVSKLALLTVALGLLACSDLKSLGEQCVFNDDCTTPFVCAAARCRAQCRTDRNCPGGQLCPPSDNPTKRVCLTPQDNAVCASDRQCPPTALCVAHACWWPCTEDVACAPHAAGVCLRPERLCAVPATVLVQREAPYRAAEAVRWELVVAAGIPRATSLFVPPAWWTAARRQWFG